MVIEQSNLANIFKALANEQRLKLFILIYKCCNDREKQADGALSCERGIRKAFTMACEHLNVSRSTVSHHLKELQNAGLVTCKREGQSFYCEVNKAAVKAIQDFLI